MKILLVNKFHYLKGGSEKYYFTLASSLKAKGYEVIYFAMHDKDNLPCAQSPYFVNEVSVNGGVKSKIKMILHMNYSKEAYRKMSDLLDKEKPDIAVLNLVHKQISLSIIDALKEHGVKIVWTMHDLITVCPGYMMIDGKGNICEKCLDGNFKHCLENRCAHGSFLMSYLSMREAKFIRKRNWYNDVDLYVCPSEFYKKKLAQSNFTNSKIVFIRNPLPIDTKYEVSVSTNKYILYFGRLSKEKGISTLIDSMKEIKYKLLILGTGPIENILKKQVIDNNLSSKVEFLGFKFGDELKQYIKDARCIVLPSEWYENGPYSAMEAMALGKPLIVSNYGGLPELVQDGINGYIFKNKQDLVKSVNKMIELDDSKYREMAIASCEFAKTSFNPMGYVDTLIKNLEEIK